MTTISAEVILDSVNSRGNRLITVRLIYPYWIHGELMTHRQFSRNASSSRAIPVKKMIAAIRQDPAVPIYWGQNQKGMQAVPGVDHNELVHITELIAIENDLEAVDTEMSREEAWLNAMDKVIATAEAFAEAGYHKQIANRLLMPFTHMRTLVSATEWSNFFGLRLHRDADPHFEHLAAKMADAFQASKPVHRKWHLPFITGAEFEALELIDAIYISCARCASVSYETVDGEPMTRERALDVYNKLAGSSPIHASPLEHVAHADEVTWGGWMEPEKHGNFRGWCQWRKELAHECL